MLKTDERSIHLGLGRQRKFSRQINRLGLEPDFLEGDKLEVALKTAAGCSRTGPAGPRPAAEVLRCYFPDDRNGVAAMVTETARNCRNTVTLGRSRRRARR